MDKAAKTDIEQPEPTPTTQLPVADDAREYLARIKAEKDAIINAEKIAAKKALQLEEKKCKDWHQWDCIVCGLHNRRPKFPKTSTIMSFDEKGVYYKRIVATVSKSKGVPQCRKCLTECDYKIPR